MRRREAQQPGSVWTAFAALVLILLVPAVAGAQQLELEIDPAKSRLEFTLDAFLHTVHGSMAVTRGQIRIDPTTGEARGSIVADARSAKTGNDGRDDRMHEEILESSKYPQIEFSPRQVAGSVNTNGRSNVQLRGVIDIHGRQQEISVPINVEFTAEDWSAEATFPVPYVKWGLKNPSTLFLRVKDTVTVTVHAAGRVSAARP
jgi:polyisoprenoid-binding protein YceI